MIKILRQPSGDFYGDVQFVEAFCKLHYPNDCLVFIFLYAAAPLLFGRVANDIHRCRVWMEIWLSKTLGP